MDRSQRSCLRLLTLGKPPFVAAGYRKALAGAASFARDAACDQLMIYQRLGLLTESVAEALKVFDGPAEEKKKATQGRILLFTGHRIDAAGREKPRFPPDQEGVACEAIKNAVAAEMTQPGGIEIGLAGGASGGDILFHEVCAELGVPTQLMLGLPRQDFVVASVAPAGPRWIERFDAIYAKPDRRELSDSAELPRWLRGKADYDVWRRNNLWMLHNALAHGPQRTTLIALWDGGKGDGPVGPNTWWRRRRNEAQKKIHLDTRELFGLPKG